MAIKDNEDNDDNDGKVYDDAVDKFCGDIGDMNERRGSDDEEQDGEHNNDGNGDVAAFNPGLQSRSESDFALFFDSDDDDDDEDDNEDEDADADDDDNDDDEAIASSSLTTSTFGIDIVGG
jgi:hypothetical protein